MLGTIFFWLGVIGLVLVVLGVRKGWILVGLAAGRFVVGPIVGLIFAALPTWAWLALVLLAPLIVLILALRSTQRLLGLLFGHTTASHVTAELILGLGRSIRRRNRIRRRG